MTINNRKWLALSVGLIFFIADRLAKYFFISRSGAVGRIFYYLPNDNLAFSLPLIPGARLFFYLFLCLIILILAGFFLRSWRQSKVIAAGAYWLVLLGALSNFLDRFRSGAVIDYIDFKIWPVFNLADVMIALGIGFLCYDLFWRRKNLK